MANTQEFNKLLTEINAGKFRPIYLLHGEEPFYIDKLSQAIEKNALEEHEKDFNQYIFYGRDLDQDVMMETLRKFPMMAQRQVIIVREAQDFQKWDAFESYFKNPVETTICVLDYKYKRADQRKKWVKGIQSTGLVYESSKHQDYELPDVITGFAKAIKYRVNPRAAQLMADYLGNDLEKIDMELKKLTITVPLSQEIGVEAVQEHIGISKEYNIFEYINALADRDVERSFRISQFLGRNEKNNPFVLTIGLVFNQFSRLMMFHGLKQKDMNSVQALPGMRSSYAAKQLVNSARKYNARETAQIISLLRDYDARAKGVDSGSVDVKELMKELTFNVLNGAILAQAD